MYYTEKFSITPESISKEIKEYIVNKMNHAEERYNNRVILPHLMIYENSCSGGFMAIFKEFALQSAGSALKDLLNDTHTVYCLDAGNSMTIQAKNKISGCVYEKTLTPNQDFEYKFPERTVEDMTVNGITMGYKSYYLDHLATFVEKYLDFVLEKSTTSRIVCNDNIRMKMKDGEVYFTANYAV